MRQYNHGFSTAIVIGAAASLAAAFLLPFVSSAYFLQLPPWLPNAIAGRVREYLISTARIPVGDHYLWGIIRDLFNAREVFVGSAILLFSVVFPFVKLIMVAALLLSGHRLSAPIRQTCLNILHGAGRYSMSDVFVVALTVVFFKADGLHFAFSARPGAYCYAVSAVLSSIGASLVQSAIARNDPLPGNQNSANGDGLSTNSPLAC